MKSITKEEKILYLILFAMFSIFTIDPFNENSMELYNLMFNQISFAFLYAPIFLYILLKIIKNTYLPEIVTRYQFIDDLIIAQTKILVFICLRVSIFSIIVSNFFLILKDINIIYYKEFWFMSILSIGTQFIGWFFIGLLYLFLVQLFRNEILVYLMEIFILVSMTIISSPSCPIFLRKFIYPIWNIMYFYEFDINMQSKIIYINLTIIINVLIIYLYRFVLKSKDIRR